MQTTLTPVDFNPFQEQNTTVLPTTIPQQEIFTNILIGGKPANCSYNESVSLILKGVFHAELFNRAVQELIERHEALRCRFSADGLSMLISPELKIDVPLIDLSAQTETEKKQRLEQFLSEEVNQEFDVLNGPLIRVAILRLDEQLHHIVLTLHHIIGDGWSLGYCMIELGKIYTAYCLHTKPELEKPDTWSDYILHESEYRSSAEYQDTINYWIKTFKDGIPAVELPINHSRPAIRTFTAGRLDLKVEPQTVSKLRAAGARAGCSFVTTMAAAFEVFIHRITGNEDIVIMLPTAGQAVTGFERLVGHCVNLIPLATSINCTQTFEQYLKQRRKTLLEQLDHQRISLGELVQKLNIERDPSRVPFSPVSFNIDIGITSGVAFHGLEMEFQTNPRAFENSEWFINCAGDGDHLVIECTYNSDLFTHEMMHLRMEEFVTLLNSLAGSFNTEIRYLEILPAHELQKVIVEWNSDFVEIPENETLNTLFEKQVSLTPDRVALWHSGKTLTYIEINNQANRLAHYLINKGFKTGMLCGVCLERKPELIIAIMAILKAGGAYIPLDPLYPDDRIQYILSEAKTNFIITQQLFKNKVNQEHPEKIVLEEIHETLKQMPESRPEVPNDEYRLAYVIYTSGSTGRPKGVAIMHHSCISLFQWAKRVYSTEDIDGVLFSTSVCFDPSVFEIFYTLLHGGRLVIVENALALASLPTDDKYAMVRQVGCIPSAAAELLNMKNGYPSSVRVIILGGEAVSTELVNKVYEQTSVERIIDSYGPTETTYNSTWALRKKNEKATIGKPLPNTQLFILDKNLQPVPIGIPGEIHLAGDGLAKGYLNREDLTRERFIPNPFSLDENARLYKTGDLGRFRSDGCVEYLGRIDFQVKLRGFRIELAEIENVLRTHPAVNELVVSVYTDSRNEKLLTAWLTVKIQNENLQDELRAFLRKSLPEYMIPQCFVFLDKMPLNPNGKIDRRQLPPPFLTENKPTSDLSFLQLSITEEKLLDIWRTILNHHNFGLDDNFFTIGGHSLLGVRLFIELEKQLGVKLPLQTLFHAPTIRQLANVIDQTESTLTWQPVVEFRKGNPKRKPLFCIHMHNGNIYRWKVLEKYLSEEQPVYAIQPKALDPRQQPHRNIKEQAAYYISEIRKLQPEGPYYFAGLCYGGTVAFEMARQLELQGQKTALCFMVNNYAPLDNQKLYRLTKGFERFLKMDFSEKVSYAIEKNIAFGKKIKNKAFQLLGKTEKLQNASETENKAHEDIRVIHTLALMNYIPETIYHGDLYIVRAGGDIEDPEFYDETLGWRKWANGKIEVVQIEGSNNDSIIEEEQYNSRLAHFLKEKLTQSSPPE